MDILTDNILHRVPTLLVGPPGCGKTARVAAAAAACGHRLIVWRLSLCERVDIGGALIPDVDAGVTRTLPLETLLDLQTTPVPTVLLLDDLGQAPTDVQAAAMRLFDAGALSPHVVIFGATNRPQDKSGCVPLCEPLRSRFRESYHIATFGAEETTAHVLLAPWKQELENWCAWAWEQPGIAAEIVAWHRSTSGAKLYAWTPQTDPAARCPDYRSWEHVIALYGRGVRDRQRIGAAIGVPAAAEFLTFCELKGDVPTPDEVWLDPTGCPVPDFHAHLGASSQYMLASMLSRAVSAGTAAAFCTYIDRLNRVPAAFAVRDAFRRVGTGLTHSKEWGAWMAANKDIFA